MTDEKKQSIPHTVRLDARKKLLVTGVRQVGDFNGQTVVLFADGMCLQVNGEELRLDRLDPETGEAAISGTVSGLFYTSDRPKAKGIAAKLFR